MISLKRLIQVASALILVFAVQPCFCSCKEYIAGRKQRALHDVVIQVPTHANMGTSEVAADLKCTACIGIVIGVWHVQGNYYEL